MKVFLDIGAHLGETLDAALDPRWRFDRISCFEPAAECWPALEARADDRVEVLRYGLWSEDARLQLHDGGEIGATLFGNKAVTTSVAPVEVRDAAAWFADHLDPEDEVVAKINCEGAECEILDRLVESGEISKLAALVVHFDVRKVPGEEHREATTRARLDRLGVPYLTPEQILFGRNATEKATNWLSWYHAGRVGRLRWSVLRRVEFGLRTAVYDARRRVTRRSREPV